MLVMTTSKRAQDTLRRFQFSAGLKELQAAAEHAHLPFEITGNPAKSDGRTDNSSSDPLTMF
jgi:hypothetical protein